MLSIRDLKKTYPATLPPTSKNLRLAHDAMSQLWIERLQERGYPIEEGRSGSCKFAALLARRLFGGRLDGNEEHVFVRKEGKVLDLNADQDDVRALGLAAHASFSWMLEDRNYRDALGSCVPRVEKWVTWVLAHPDVERGVKLPEDLSP